MAVYEVITAVQKMRLFGSVTERSWPIADDLPSSATDRCESGPAISRISADRYGLIVDILLYSLPAMTANV